MSMINLTNTEFLAGVDNVLWLSNNNEEFKYFIDRIRATTHMTVDQNHFLDAIFKHKPSHLSDLPEKYLAKLLFSGII